MAGSRLRKPQPARRKAERPNGKPKNRKAGRTYGDAVCGGKFRSGKSHFLYQRMLDEAGRHPDRRYLVIVPEQFGMQTQKELVSMSGRAAS